MLLKILLLLATVCFMEFAAWFVHKYVMHGPLWVLHKDHHQTTPGWFEWNDLFFLIFAVPSWLFIMFGMMTDLLDWRVFVGFGILIYGLLYFVVHEIFIHQRFKFLRTTDVEYFKKMRKAHYVHHKLKEKEGGTSFGMLIFPGSFK